ncbi:hypothetical protein JJD41_01285 [Oxynema sp. CENA135]|nr:hypothetical protein [Oxynema sp. CENA135]MBK4728523.1 hypothetical protein [Oxynema sp. CENA135]
MRLGKCVAIAYPVRVLELSQDRSFPRVTEEGYIVQVVGDRLLWATVGTL